MATFEYRVQHEHDAMEDLEEYAIYDELEADDEADARAKVVADWPGNQWSIAVWPKTSA